jgi:hypothetical protein
MPPSNQRLRSFLAESRAVIFSQWKQDYPLRPPINRGEFISLSIKKIRCKNWTKSAPIPRFLPFFFSPRHLSRRTTPPPAWSLPDPPQVANPTTSWSLRATASPSLSPTDFFSCSSFFAIHHELHLCNRQPHVILHN